jgi:hypothetical protein
MGALAVGLTAFAGGQGGDGGGWEIEKVIETPLAGKQFINHCAVPPQLIELTEGTHHKVLKATRVLDEGGLLQAFDLHNHANHQGAKGIGYDLVVDDAGNPVKQNGQYVKATDENGQFITTEYEIPGTYNVNQRIHKGEGNDGNFTRSGTFMCKLVSHGNKPDVMYHWNEHMNITAEGEITIDQENAWCKCTGAGPDINGEVDCAQYPDSCIAPPF